MPYTPVPGGSSGGGTDLTGVKVVTVQSESALNAEVSLGALTTGLLKHTVAAGVSTPATATGGTDYVVPGGVAGGQTVNGGTAASEHLTLVSTANATKGQVRLGSSTGLIFDGPTGDAAIGGTVDANHRLKVTKAGDVRVAVISTGSNVLAAFVASANAGETEAVTLLAGSNDEAGALVGVNKASAAMMIGGSQVESIVVGGSKATSDLYLCPGNTVKVTIDQDGNWTLIDGADITLGSTDGTKIGTATTQKLSFYNATPVDQPATVADPAGGGTQDAEARTAIIALIDRLQELGLIA